MTQRIDYQAVAPAGVRAFGSVYGYVQACGLPAQLVELVYLRVSQINGCAYCIDMHTASLRHGGVSERKLALLPVWREVPALFDARECAALDWAETVTKVAETHVPDAAYQAAAAVFAEKELADLTIAVGLMNMLNRMAISFRRTPEAVAQLGGP